MATLRLISILAASSLAGAGAVYAQSATNPQSSSPSSASSPHQRDVTSQGATEATPNQSPDANGASSPHQRSATHMAKSEIASGMEAQSTSGEPLGTVSEVVPKGGSEHGYVIIYGTSSGAGASTTPVPYSTASTMMKHGRLVFDKSKFDEAPKVEQSQLQDESNKSWQKKADGYWKKQQKSAGQG
jgi:hypothetical protein